MSSSRELTSLLFIIISYLFIILFLLFYYCRSKWNGSWSSTGCSLVKKANKEITCTCNHLTNFAVLMQVGGNEVGEKVVVYLVLNVP